VIYMALTNSVVERLVKWCYTNEAIANIRAQAREHFFGGDDIEVIDYIADTGNVNSRERRFMGWFTFYFKLPDGRHPAELAAYELLKQPRLDLALDAIQKARYVTGVVTRVIHDRGFHLELEDEKFVVNSPVLSRIVRREQLVSAHILPNGQNRWLVGPGWLAWPISPGPHMRPQLKTSFQPDPVELERFLQGKTKTSEEIRNVEHPQDDTLEAAVARMSEIAKKEGKPKLILSPEEWKNIVLSYMANNDAIGFSEEIRQRAENLNSIEELNKWLALAMNIWNTTPQPDRGGKSAIEIIRQQRGNRKS